MTVASPVPSQPSRRWVALHVLLLLAIVAALLAPMATLEAVRAVDLAPPDHLVISEVVTGGASASDELIELHNPTTVSLPLEGLEVIYVTSTGATITRRAAWALGAASVPPGGHALIANASGIYASIADATYTSGMAATGGSVAVRILGATTAIDAAGWGTAASAWMEGTPAVAPAAGASIERLPGGTLGSGQDTGDNAVDFVERLAPEPQNLGSPPTPDPAGATPSAQPSMTPEPPATPGPTPGPTLLPSPMPVPTPTATPAATVAEARAAPDGSIVTIEAVALTGSGFHDGGGFVADVTGGIAVLITEGTFARGERLRITGELDDRFSQRTLRAGSAASLGTAAEPEPTTTTTGEVGENLEGRLVATRGAIVGSPTTLSSGLAFDIDDGSGATRVVIGTATGIDTSAWLPGMDVALAGVAGQRDSTGSGTDGYRVLLRDIADVISLKPPAGPPAPGGGDGGVTSIAEARQAERETTLTIRGIVTLPSGLVDDGTAVVQDATGAILLRIGADAGRLRLGARVEASGKRSTLSGMESLRVTEPIVLLGNGAEPAPRRVRTGGVREADEARLVVASGALVASARRASSGTVSFEIDDGSGPLRVSLSAALRADRDSLSAGTWVEVRGVLGQETSLAQPDEGYRIWPRSSAEVRVTAPAAGDGGEGSGGAGSGSAGSGGGSSGPAGSLGDVNDADLAHLRIAATLVVGRWTELGLGGLLWDGSRLVAVHASSRAVVSRLTHERRPPLALDLGGLQVAGIDRATGVPAVRLGSRPGQTTAVDAQPAPPRGTLRGDVPAWVSVVGQLSGSGSRRVLTVDGEGVALHERCEEADDHDDDDRHGPRGAVSVIGVALGDPVRLLVPCGGLRSAPSIAGDATLAAVGRGASAPLLAPHATGGGAAVDPRRPIVAGLLLAAAAVLVGGAALGRRRGSRAEEPASPDDADAAAGPETHLTLVRVPHEGGP